MDRSVLVTGGSRGIGLAIAQAFAAHGDRVSVTYNTSPPPDGIFAVKCDVTDSTAVDEAFTTIAKQHGDVQVLVSNAGITDDRLLMQMTEQSFTTVVDTNLTGAWRVARRAITRMALARPPYGRMVFISSVAALRGETGQSNYTASKAGLIGMARSLGREYGAKNVTANVVLPGLIDTDMLAPLKDKKPEQLAQMIRDIPAGRLGQPADVAGVVLFLASDAASYVNGAVLAVDGGVGGGH